MKYKLIKPLPGIEVGTMYPVDDPCTEQEAKLNNFATQFGTDNDFFEKIADKKKALPDEGDMFFRIENYGDINLNINCLTSRDNNIISQGNWRWTREEAEKEVRKREAIEKCRQYLVENDMLLSDEEVIDDEVEKYNIYYNIERNEFYYTSSMGYIRYSPYGYISSEEKIFKFINDMKEELLLIHKP